MKEQGEACDGSDLGASCASLGWSGGMLACSASCSFDESGCSNAPACQHGVTPLYPSSSYAAPYSCPGGVVMPAGGSIDASGYLTLTAASKPGGYGAGTYRVLVFDPDDPAGDQCKPWNAVKATKVLNGSAGSITFAAFDSLLACGGASKGYCIVKEDGGSIAHFCSGRLLASYQ
jgi:hypothetical protein